MQRLSVIGLVVLTMLAVLATLYLATNYFDERNQLADAAFAAAQAQAGAAATDMDGAFRELMTIADGIADELSTGELAYADVNDRLQETVRRRPDIDGLAVTFEPFVFNPDVRLYQTYIFQTEDGSFDTLTGATYDYTRTDGDTSTAWYVDTINNGAQWHEPFLATGAGKILVEYGVPFYRLDDDTTPAGIVTIDYTLTDVTALIQDLELGAVGYGFVMTDQGTFLAHPVQELVVSSTIFDAIGDNDVLAETARDALTGERVSVETEDPISGVDTWYFFEPIEGTGWTVGIVLNRRQFQPNAEQTVRDQMTIALSLSATVFLLLSTVFHADRLHFTNFWAVSATFSLLCVGLIVLAWVLTNRVEAQLGVSITSQSELDRYIEAIERPPGAFNGPLEIPTGILIQAMDFPDPTSVTVNGYIWQVYPLDVDVQRGFSLPDQIGVEATLEEIRRETIDDELEIIVWYIGVDLRQRYDTIRFPFDQRNIEIRMMPADLQADVVLTPALEAYDFINPELLPGVDALADINNWWLMRSEFSYVPQQNLTNFGLPSLARDTLAYELRFNIYAQRNYLGPFIAYLLPGFIALIMTFAYLLSGRGPGDDEGIISALNYAAAVFFVVAVIHTALRAQIAAVGITYMEYVYILLYLAIIGVAGNSFVRARFPEWGVVSYENNLIPKVLYWPLLAGAMLITTMVIFVY